MPPTLWASGTWGTATPPTFLPGRGPLELYLGFRFLDVGCDGCDQGYIELRIGF